MWSVIFMQNMRYQTKFPWVNRNITSVQVNLVIPYIQESRLRVKENVWKCVNHDKDSGNRWPTPKKCSIQNFTLKNTLFIPILQGWILGGHRRLYLEERKLLCHSPTRQELFLILLQARKKTLNNMTIDHVVWILSAYLYLPWNHHHHQHWYNKFALFQTRTMTDEELDLYWAEIAQVKKSLCFYGICCSIKDLKFSNFQNVTLLHYTTQYL